MILTNSILSDIISTNLMKGKHFITALGRVEKPNRVLFVHKQLYKMDILYNIGDCFIDFLDYFYYFSAIYGFL